MKSTTESGTIQGIGDVTSDERGTGARYNAGKVPYELIAWYPFAMALPSSGPGQSEVRTALMALGHFQAGGRERDLHDVLTYTRAAAGITLTQMYAETANVLDYGRIKYAEWNWAKGMPWSVPIACAARHLLGTPGNPGMWADQRGIDPDSGLFHAGHVGCNVMFLLQYMETYPEGDDRPKALIPRPF